MQNLKGLWSQVGPYLRQPDSVEFLITYAPIWHDYRRGGFAQLDDLIIAEKTIEVRERILRAMAGASLADYDKAYRQAKGGGASVLPASALTLDGMGGAAALRKPSADAKPLERFPQKAERTREASDLMWRLNEYKTIDCSCGTKLRVSPGLGVTSVRCPHCGRTHQVKKP